MGVSSDGDAATALRPIGGFAEVQVVGVLSDRVIERLAFKTCTRRVWIHQDVVTHVLERRGRLAEFVLRHMSLVVVRPQFAAIDRTGSSRIRLIGSFQDPACHLHIALKFVAAPEARSKRDEFWVSTAYRMGTKSLTRLKNKTTLLTVDND
jgi:hypothetical protein